jgi:uncharacterized membrane protein
MDVYGLPLHPLVVHAVVVLLPLAALGTLAVVVSGWVRERYGWLTAAFAVAAAAAAIVARLSGEALALSFAALPPGVVTHRMWGQLTPFAALLLAIALPVGLAVRKRSRIGWRVAAGLSVVAALAALVLVVLTGHSGSVAVWGS